MFNLLFSLVPDILFAPIAIASLIGIIFFLIETKGSGWFIVLLIFLGVTLSWRLLFHDIITSSRYCSILIYPGGIFSAFCCQKSGPFFVWICSKCPLSNIKEALLQRCRYVFPLLLFSGLCIISVCKTLHYNPFDDYPIKICQSLLSDMKDKEKVTIYSMEIQEISRFSFYLNKQFLFDAEIKALQLSGFHYKRDRLLYNLNHYKNTKGTYYYFITRKNDEPEYTAESLGLEKEEWNNIFRSFMSRNKKKEILLYRYTPSCRNVTIWTKEIHPLHADNICQNGDFEKALDPKKNQEKIIDLAEKGFPTYKDNYLSFPAAWWTNTDKYDETIPPLIFLKSQQPLCGRYSLALDTRHADRDARIRSRNIPHGKYVYSGFVRNEFKSLAYVSAGLCCQDQKTRDITYLSVIDFYVYPGEICRFEGKVSDYDFHDTDDLYLRFESKGFVMLDNVEIINSD